MARGKGRRKSFKPKTTTPKQDSDNRGGGWTNTRETQNADFEKYYKAQNIVDESQWSVFMQHLRSPLPTSFRLSFARSVSKSLNERIIKHFVPALEGLEFQGEQLQAPKQIPWYPEGFAWDFDLAKTKIKRNDEFQQFQSFMVHETDSGNMTRQEIVSMIPPLLLDVKPYHYVLDTCSAPGSKTSQILEFLLHDAYTGDKPSIPSGLLIANDQSAPRCHMLVHQSLNRIPSPLMIVTNCDASLFPKLWIDRKAWNAREEANGQSLFNYSQKDNIPLLFDRILCDVPCTGDGTARKNVNVWKDWKFNDAIVLHNLQLRILCRAFELLRPGGRIVYSTCSLNPLENEAIVSAALNLFPDSLRLVDVSTELDTLKRAPGMHEWKVYAPWGQEVHNMSEVEEGIKHGLLAPDSKGRVKNKMAATMWPNGRERERNLERCLRIYPHLQNTGGFFVAVLVKVKEESEGSIQASSAETSVMPVDEVVEVSVVEENKSEGESITQVGEKRSSTELDAAEEGSLDEPPSKKLKVEQTKEKKRGPDGYNEEPFTYLPSNSSHVNSIFDFYAFSQDLPRNEFLIRSNDPESTSARNIYYTSPSVKSVLDANSYQKLRVISCGLKAFSRSSQDKYSTKCAWRLLSEGLECLKPFMLNRKRIFKVDKTIFEDLIANNAVTVVEIKDDQLRGDIDSVEIGSIVIECDGPWGDTNEYVERISLPAWKSKSTFMLMVDKKEKSALSLRIYGVDKTPHAPKEKAKAKDTTEDTPEISVSVAVKDV